MRKLILFAILALVPEVTLSQSMESMQKAQELGSLLASEEMCGFVYDQDSISSWIDQNTDASDMGFASTLAMMTDGAKFQFSSMNDSSKTAHCRSIERTAKHFGFIK